MKDYISLIRNKGINGALIDEMIQEHKLEHDRMLQQYNRYKTDDVPILHRRTMEARDFETDRIQRVDNLVNNTLNNSFDSEIVDTKVGYMLSLIHI